ncbi:MAG TPA: S-methyl-5'-thioadenosine phosphorylase [Candidatus Binatia bacterium]|nr:S-methyl-5'-thioadenosine phosphorylase [Candidatus Binatia bacterium]
MITVGVIGGSGLYHMTGVERGEWVAVETPFGAPSDAYFVGELAGVRVVFLPRHGRGHRLLPSELNFRANVYGMKKLGVEWLIAVSAVGSLKKEIAPGHIVVPDQFIDRTRGRIGTFFGRGIVAHVSFADPVCGQLAALLAAAGRESGAVIHAGGTYVCMEGPQFSTRAESFLYRSWGADIIGMTNLQEAKLAREAEMCFATLALATDYDCWNTEAGDVVIEDVLAVLRKNVVTAQAIIRGAVTRLPAERSCPCARALRDAIITDRALIPAAVKQELAILVGKYLGE